MPRENPGSLRSSDPLRRHPRTLQPARRFPPSAEPDFSQGIKIGFEEIRYNALALDVDALIRLLRLPPAAVLGRRINKDDVAGQVNTAADRGLIKDRTEALAWHASLNTASTGLPADGTPGLAVVTLEVRGEAAAPPRLLQLIHRVVPDPVLLITAEGETPKSVSVRPAMGQILAAAVPGDGIPDTVAALLATDRAASIADLQRRWAEAVLALRALAVTGKLPQPGRYADLIRDTDDACPGESDRRSGPAATLQQIEALDREIRKLTGQARREKQAGRRAELNQLLQRARRRRAELTDAL